MLVYHKSVMEALFSHLHISGLDVKVPATILQPFQTANNHKQTNASVTLWESHKAFMRITAYMRRTFKGSTSKSHLHSDKILELSFYFAKKNCHGNVAPVCAGLGGRGDKWSSWRQGDFLLLVNKKKGLRLLQKSFWFNHFHCFCFWGFFVCWLAKRKPDGG